jgi:hypothetical protein
MKKQCLECNESISGRADKKFCSDACRNAYNNRFNKDATNYIRNVNNTLRKNRRILNELNPNGKAKLDRAELIQHGFNFSYFTSVYQTKTGNLYKYCYDEGYLELEDGKVALVKKQEWAG